MKKYKIHKKCAETNLYYIRALIDIPRCGVKKGDIGGRIESESNLSQEGNAWVFGDAQVSGDARVSGNARVYGDAQVSGDARVYGNDVVSKSTSCQYLKFLPYDITITDNRVTIGCQQYTFEEFYGTCEEEALAEGYTKLGYEELRSILIPLMIRASG